MHMERITIAGGSLGTSRSAWISAINNKEHVAIHLTQSSCELIKAYPAGVKVDGVMNAAGRVTELFLVPAAGKGLRLRSGGRIVIPAKSLGFEITRAEVTEEQISPTEIKIVL
jgi:hypothetical protein